MARVEADLGVRATYYLMMRSPLYNLLSHAGLAAAATLAELGHDLAVHLDLDEPRDGDPPIERVVLAASLERNVLAQHLGRVTRRLSFHCPPVALLWREVPCFDSAYAPCWRGRYRADSRGAFLLGDPEDAPAGRLQVNLHPEHWFGGMPDVAEHPGFWR